MGTLPAPTTDLDRAEHDLSEHAICAVEGVLDEAALATARHAMTASLEDDRSPSSETDRFALDLDASNQRVWNLLNRSPLFVELAEHPIALHLLRSVLGEAMLLGNFSGNVTGPNGTSGVLHADQLFIPQPWPAAPQGANAAWAIDDFTAENGATRFVPGSHLLNRLPTADDQPTAIPYEAAAGTLIVFDSRLWHQTGANTTADQHRAAAFAWYHRPIYRTQENWFLSLDDSIRRNASDQLLRLLGYKTKGLGLVNGSSPA